MSKNKKNIPNAPEEVKENNIPATTDNTPQGEFLRKYAGMDANHIADCLTGMKEMVHDDPQAATKYHLTEEAVNNINEITLVGFATLIALEVKTGRSEFAMNMKRTQLEALNSVSEYTGVTFDTKLLENKFSEAEEIEVPSSAVKVDKAVATNLQKEAEEAKKVIELDPTKFKSEEDLYKAISHVLTTEKNAFTKFSTSIALYQSYYGIVFKDDKQKFDAMQAMTPSAILEDIFAHLDRIPVLLNGFGKVLYTNTAKFKNPVVAFSIFRESSRNKTTGIPALDDSTLAGIVKVLVQYCAKQYIAEQEAKIKEAEKDIEMLSKDKKKNAKGIEDANERIKTYNTNIDHINDVALYVSEPSSELADNFITNIEDRTSEGYKGAREIFGFITRGYYGVDAVKTYNQNDLKKNVQQYIGIITNMFRESLERFTQYDVTKIADIEPIAASDGEDEKN